MEERISPGAQMTALLKTIIICVCVYIYIIHIQRERVYISTFFHRIYENITKERFLFWDMEHLCLYKHW